MASQANLYVRPEHIYTGGWTNWNDNGAGGGKITMAKDKAELFNIFLGIFLLFAQAGLWVMITFVCFHCNRRRRTGTTASARRDGLFHQQQTILRNGVTPITIATAYFHMWKAWGSSKPNVIRRTWPMIIAAVISFGFFVVALPFITALAMLDNQGDEILIQSPNCGFWKPLFAADMATASMELANRSWEGAAYVDSCYESQAPSALCDRFLPQRRLPTFGWTDTVCPFGDGLCLGRGKFAGVILQTKILDSHVDFGFNAPPKDRIKLQRTTVCAPLDATKFTDNSQGRLRGEEKIGVYFGPSMVYEDGYTYRVSTYKHLVADAAYHLHTVYSHPENGTATSDTSTFTPIDGLVRKDADVSIVFLNNNRVPIKGIDGPCSDPFFSATKEPLGAEDYYLPDSPITAIGCTDQYAFGTPVPGQWSEPMSSGDVINWNTYGKGWNLSPRQVAAITALSWSLIHSGGIDRVIVGLGTDALLAKKFPGTFLGSFQSPIPNDQWKKEVSYWFKNGLAKLQLRLVGIAIGPPDTTLPGWENMLPAWTNNNTEVAELVCNSQKVHNIEFKNFHRAGFIALAVIGGLLILFPPVIRWLIIWRWRWREDVLSWTSYGQLQLQRMAAEDAGVHGWQNFDGDTPFLKQLHAEAGDLDASRRDNQGVPHPLWDVP